MSITSNQKKLADDQIRELAHVIDYDTRDYPIGFIVDNFQKGEYYVPDYQREFVWLDKIKSKFLESLLLDFPIPLIFLADTETGELEIVDGVQRISTLNAFINEGFVLKGLEKLKKLNDFTFKDLSMTQQRRLNNKSLRVIVLTENTTLTARKELFERLNTTAKKLSDSEIRSGAYKKDFVDFINKLASDKDFQTIAPVSTNRKKRKEHLELVYRFFAYSNNYLGFNHGVESFVNDYIVSVQDKFDENEMESEFYRMINFAKKYFTIGFKKTENATSTPRVRFEALSVGINLALRKKASIKPKDISKWIDSKEFRELTTSDGSNAKSKVRKRIEFVRDKLLES